MAGSVSAAGARFVLTGEFGQMVGVGAGAHFIEVCFVSLRRCWHDSGQAVSVFLFPFGCRLLLRVQASNCFHDAGKVPTVCGGSSHVKLGISVEAPTSGRVRPYEVPNFVCAPSPKHAVFISPSIIGSGAPLTAWIIYMYKYMYNIPVTPISGLALAVVELSLWPVVYLAVPSPTSSRDVSTSG